MTSTHLPAAPPQTVAQTAGPPHAQSPERPSAQSGERGPRSEHRSRGERGSRIAGLDALRGFALAGIIFVNAPSILGLSPLLPDGSPNPVSHWLDLFVQQRFFPIFSLLFGVGFGMLWRIAGTRTSRPRLALARRLGVLVLLGAAHQFLQPGEALLPYGLAGLVFLLPATFLPDRRWARVLVPAAGAALLLTALLLTGGGPALIPGLFLLGFAAGEADLARRIESSPRTWWIASLLAVTTAAAGTALLTTTSYTERALWQGFALESALGLVMAAAYVSAFIAVLHSPLRRVLTAAFGPLGRMALTNYVTATLLLVGLRLLPSGLDPAGAGVRDWTLTMVFCGAVLAVQWIWSSLWLMRFRQGPLERMWRMATWWRV